MHTPSRRLFAVPVALCALLALLFRPGPEAPEEPPAPPPRPVPAAHARPAVAAPAPAVAAAPEAPDRCHAIVQVVDDRGDAVAGVPLELDLEGDWVDGRTTDHHGLAEWPDLTCPASGSVKTGAGAPVIGAASVSFMDTWRRGIVVLQAERGVVVSGVVSGSDGSPLEGAFVMVLGHDAFTESDADGRYALRLPTGARGELSASADAHAPATHAVPDDAFDDDGEWQHDVELEAQREVAVVCLGLPDDDCLGMMLTCSAPDGREAEACLPQTRMIDGDLFLDTVCPCPAGDALVSTEDREVALGPDDIQATLDFSMTAEVRGRAILHGDPVELTMAIAYRATDSGRPLQGGPGWGNMVANLAQMQRTANGDPDAPGPGGFLVSGVSAGTWMVEVSSQEGGEHLSRIVGPLAIGAGDDVDLGDVVLGLGGAVSGTLTTTDGSPASWGRVEAHPTHTDGAVRAPRFTTADDEGLFQLHDLAPGTWRVVAALTPQSGVTLVVEEGLTTDGVEVVQEDHTELAGLGLTVQADEDGVHVVALEAGGPAAGALQVGDVLVGVAADDGAPWSISDLDPLGGADPGQGRGALLDWEEGAIALTIDGPDGPREVTLMP